MKFTLIYDGELPAGDKKRARYASKIRNILHPQMRDLWDNHVLMRQPRHTARFYKRPTAMNIRRLPTESPDYTEEPKPVDDSMVDCTAPISIPNSGRFLPIVRKSLYVACAIDLLFLRHEEPQRLFEGSGDLDNRLKCFFDALTIPNKEQSEAGEPPCADPLCCLLEDDRYISDFSVRTGRLLGKDDKHKHDVRIQAEITIKVLRVFEGNFGLVGG